MNKRYRAQDIDWLVTIIYFNGGASQRIGANIDTNAVGEGQGKGLSDMRKAEPEGSAGAFNAGNEPTLTEVQFSYENISHYS